MEMFEGETKAESVNRPMAAVKDSTSPLEKACRNLNDATGRVLERFDTLYDRLRPVSRTMPSKPGPISPDENSTVVNAINAETTRLYALAEGISQQIDELDV